MRQWNPNCFPARYINQEPQIVLPLEFKLELTRFVWADVKKWLAILCPQRYRHTVRRYPRMPLIKYLSNHKHLATEVA